MQNVIVFVIILTAAIYLVRRFVRSLSAKSPSNCGCGCTGCGSGGPGPASGGGIQIQDKPDHT